ncbi:AraC family transcriptional regulator [Paenibacillus sp. PAMC21692]|uniref:AraC family transcriptional regulator n=1 Tax=Paenibacillus sp. PAMC21692 TaxID=2762320 RepID=UPI00164CF2B8|nr:AraC family transcriptional regulator [Paenibacillus sp. PAMC21692]QNK58044.1 AraC family transcriptional regulator [Paenibacillus sp. PAMC21692]
MTGYTYYFPIAVHQLSSGQLPWSTAAVGPREPVIILVTDGWARVIYNGVERELERHTILCCNASSSLEWVAEKAFKAIVAEYRALTLDGMPPAASGLPEKPVKGSSDAFIQMGRQLELAWANRQEEPLEPQRIFLKLLTALLEQYKQAGDGVDVPWLANIIDLLHRRFREEWSRDALSANAKVSAEHLSRVFRKKTGMTYTAYLNLMRVREAQLLILKGHGLNLNEIARHVGYRDGYYLSKKFKALLNLSPANYRNKPRRIVASTYNYTEMLIGLGIEPVLGAYSAWSSHRNPGHRSEEGMRELCWSEGIGSYKTLERLQPDIILVTDDIKEDRQLYRYAAVEAIPMTKLPWREQFRRVAEIAGKLEAAEKIIKGYDRMAAESNAKLDTYHVVRGTAAVWEIYADSAYVFHCGFGRGTPILYDDLGFLVPQELVDRGITNKGCLSFPVMEVPDIDCDYLFITMAHDSLSFRQLLQSKAWSRLTAVRRGNVHILNDFGRFYGIDPKSIERQLESLMDCFLP